jgi:hypothetical protein
MKVVVAEVLTSLRLIPYGPGHQCARNRLKMATAYSGA